AFGYAHAHGGDMQTAFVQHFHGRFEAYTLSSTDQILGGHPAILEDDVTGMRAALSHFLVDFSQRYSGATGFDHKGGNPAASFLGGISACHHRKNTGFWRIGNESFCAIDDIVIAVA